jgi:hypothetical protein
MTSQEPTNRPQTSTDPVLRWIWGCTSALVVALTIVAIIALFNALIRGPGVSRTATGPQQYAVST